MWAIDPVAPAREVQRKVLSFHYLVLMRSTSLGGVSTVRRTTLFGVERTSKY